MTVSIPLSVSYVAHFWVGSLFLYLDISSFVINLQKRRDSSFYLCGEVAQYVYRLYFRCYNPDTVPLENSWFLLLNFQVSEGTFMPVDELLTRLKMTNKVSKASKQKAEGIHSGKRVEKNVIAKTAGTVKEEFVRDGQSYLQFLVSQVLRHAGLSSNLVKGLAAFDPFVMFKRPVDVALRHFDMLYNTFLLRSWVTVTNESACRDEYLGLLDHLRSTYSSSFEITDSSRGLIEFLINLDFVQTHQHLLHLFKLCCLCATSVGPSYPAVTMGSISTSGYQSRFTDVILPCQSYLSSVSDSVAFCSNDTNCFSLSSRPPLVSRLSLPHMSLGHTWMLLGEVKSTRLSCPLAVLLHRSHWTRPACLLSMIFPLWATPLLFDSLVKGSGGKWSSPPLAQELP